MIDLIKKLREETGLSLRDCKKMAVYTLENFGHLTSDAQVQKAVEWHREMMRPKSPSVPQHIYVISELQEQIKELKEKLVVKDQEIGDSYEAGWLAGFREGREDNEKI